MNNLIKKYMLLMCLLLFNCGIIGANTIECPVDTTEVLSDVMLQKCYDTYMQGVNAELAGDTIKAIEHYQQYLSSKCRHEKLNNIEIDLLARFIGISISRDDWENVCNLGGRLLTIDTATQEQYSNIPWMYLGLFRK